MQHLSEKTGFPVYFPGSAEALARSGGKISYILIDCFRSTTSATNHPNRLMYVKVTARQKW